MILLEPQGTRSGGRSKKYKSQPRNSGPKTVDDKVLRILESCLCVDEDELTPGAMLTEDLGADFLDRVELVMTLEEKFRIAISDAVGERLKTVGDVQALVRRLLAEASTTVTKEAECETQTSS